MHRQWLSARGRARLLVVEDVGQWVEFGEVEPAPGAEQVGDGAGPAVDVG